MFRARLSAADIIASSTYNVSTALNNNVAKISRSCYASDIMEKATWIDTDLAASPSFNNLAWSAAGTNPNMFCPSFAFTCLSPSLGAAHNVVVSFSFTYYLAFRNPKYGGASSSAKSEDLGVRRVSFPDAAGGADDGDMNDGDNGAAAAAAADPDADEAAFAEPAPKKSSKNE